MHNITCLAWELFVCWGRSLSWSSSSLCSPTAAFSCLLSNCSPSCLPSVLSTCFFCVNCTLAVIQAHGRQTSSTWNSPSFSHWAMLLQMWQGLLIIRIIGGISRGTCSTWNGDEKQSHFYGRKSGRRRRRRRMMLLTNMTRNCLIFEDGSTDNQRRFGNTNVHSNILPTDAQAPKLYTMWTGCCSSVNDFYYVSHLFACTWRRWFERPKFRNHDNRIMNRNKPPIQAL